MNWEQYYKNRIPVVEDLLSHYHDKEIFSEVLKNNPKKVLEVGSGRGTMGIFLSYMVSKVVSIDNDKGILKNAEAANKNLKGKCKFKFADAFNLPFKDKEFDISFSQGFFEHFNKKQIFKLLSEQIRVTKDKIVISIPNNNYGVRDYGNEWLISTKEWARLIKQYNPSLRVKAYSYQTMLRKDWPFRTIYNLIMNKKVQTMLVIKL